MVKRSSIAIAGAVILLLVSTSTATGSPPGGQAATATIIAAATGAAGHDYATDTFADPWDYSNADDLLLDGGPAINAVNPQVGNGTASMRFTDNGYVSPIWGGYGGPLFIGRDGGKPGSALDTGRYRTVSFQAYSSRDVGAGLFWFNCPRAVVGSDCGGGVPFLLKAGWNTYVITPGASAFGGWPLAWGGSVTGLRLAVSPGPAGSDFVLDWFRVTEPNSGATVSYANPGGGSGDLVWDGDSDSSNNDAAHTNWGVLAQVTAAYGAADLSALPAGSYRIGVRRSGTVASWTAVTLSAPLPRFITPNAVGDRDYAATVFGNPWDMNGYDDVAGIGNATGVSYAGGQLTATNTSNDPWVAFRLGAGGVDTRVYRNLTITSDYDGAFDLRDIAGGGTMGRWVWSRADGQGGQTGPVLTYAGPRTVTVDMGLPDAQLLEPDNPGASFLSASPVTVLRWDPNEDRGGRRWYVKDVQLRSDFSSTGSFSIRWEDAAYAAGSTATLTADTDRSGCNGITVAVGVGVDQGTNTTIWNTGGVASGRYWLCLTITHGSAVTSAYAGGVLVVGESATADSDPVGSWDGSTLSGRTFRFSGWAFDPNVPRQASTVDVTDRRPDGSTGSTGLLTSGSRPDVAAAYPGVGGSTGFAGSLQLTGAGRHQVCATAINVGVGNNHVLHCVDVDVPGPSGFLDSVTSNGLGTLAVSGWAADPDGPAAAEDVHLYVTGPEGSTLTVGRTGNPRGDVPSVFRWVGPNSGFAATVPAAGEGINRVCAYAINLKPPNTNPSLGCRYITLRNAFGNVDGVTVSGGRIVATGWALNPNRPSVPVTVHVYDAGPTGVRGPTEFLANGSRPDVAAAYSGYGPAHGFSASIAATGAGRHTVCVYAITTGGGAGNPSLGCRDVVVS